MMVRPRVFVTGATAIAMILSQSGCNFREIQKSHATWSRSYEAEMSPQEMKNRAARALESAGLAPVDQLNGVQATMTSTCEPVSLTYAWRASVWLCLGAPTEFAAITTVFVVLAVPTLGGSIEVYQNLYKGVAVDLSRNSMSISFEVENIGDGRCRGACTFEVVGMVQEAKIYRSAVWSSLDEAFPTQVAPILAQQAKDTPTSAWK